MKIARNAPCPCGSGKKYKKCCMRKDQQEAFKAAASDEEETVEEKEAIPQTQRDYEDSYLEAHDAVANPGEVADFKEDSPPAKNFDEGMGKAFWDNFDAADFRGRESTIEALFHNQEFKGADTVFELFNGLYEVTANAKERKIFNDLVEKLKEKEPDIYKKEAGHLLGHCVSHALMDHRPQEIDRFMKEFAHFAHSGAIDSFNHTLTEVAYHGHLRLLAETMSLGWEKVKNSSEIVPWGIDEYTNQACDYELLNYLSQASTPDAGDPILLERLEKYFELSQDRFAQYFACLTRTCGHTWRMEDFVFQKEKKGENSLSKETVMINLDYLTHEFLDYLYKDEQIAYPKAEMMRTEMRNYLRDRMEGELEDRPSPLELARNPRKKWKKTVTKIEHNLCPDRATLDRFLGEKLGFMNMQLYRALACFEGIPPWLRFLEANGLIDFAIRKQSLLTLSNLYPSLERLVIGNKSISDEVLEAFTKAWNDSAIHHD